jgi:hypothetical protein
MKRGQLQSTFTYPLAGDWNFDIDYNNELESEVEDNQLESVIDEQYRKYCEKTYQVITDVKNLGMPLPGEQLRLITFRAFNSAVFLAYICETETIDMLYLAVYSINFDASKLLNEKINEGKIKKAVILMSNYRNSSYRKKEEMTNQMFINNPNIELFFCQSHAKIISMKTSKGNYYHFEGSGNMTFSSRIEQYIIDNDKGLFEFTANWFEKIKVYLKGKKELVLK